ncbi:MAG: trypsin-like peptidase domain-containing protein [Deltaproteobacteria bacterium]|nr:trypsin-like peptidase domain-containing protein [Deltaproteobacteria bacterium]
MRSMPLAACATLLTVTGLGLVGCDAAELNEGARGGTPRVIYGPDDNRGEVEDGIDSDGTVALMDWSSLRYKRRNDTWEITSNETFSSVSGYPVCDHEPYKGQPNPAWCSGFLVAPDIIATAGHCMDWCSDTAFVFGFQTVDDEPKMTFDNDDVYGCGSVLAAQQTGSGSDWALVQLDRPVVGHAPLVYRESGIIPDNEPIYVIGHPVGLPKKYADGATVRDNSPGPYFVAPLDTYGGNSGSAVFSTNTALVEGTPLVEGILVRGEADFVYNETLECVESNWCLYDGCTGEEVTRITEIQLYLNCPEDELDEPNNTQATAALIDKRGYDDLFICNDDWYAVDVDANETLYVSIDFLHGDGDLDMELSDAEGIIETSGGTSNSEEISFTSDITQRLFVRVFGWNGAMNGYDMHLGDGPPAPTLCTDDGYEDNDAQTSATTDFPTKTSVNDLQICADDDDWYEFVVDPWDTLTATATFVHANGDVDAELFDIHGIADRSAGITGIEEVWYTNPEGGSMWVRVYGYNGDENEYTLKVTVEEAPECDDDLYDTQGRDNDTLETATPLAAGSHTGLEVCTGDDDWYSVDLGPDEMLTATILFTHANGDLESALYFDDVEVDWSATITDNEVVKFAPPGGGTVYLLVYGFNNATNTYTMNLTVADTAPVISVTSTRYRDRKHKLEVRFTTNELATGSLCESGNPDNCRESSLGYSHRITLTTENSPALLTATNQSGIPSAPIEIEF